MSACDFVFRMMGSMEEPPWVLAMGWLLSGLGIAGNCFIILLIASKKQLHRTTNWFLVSLSFADLGVSLSVFPGDFFCLPVEECQFVVLASFQWAFLFASVLNLCALTMDRYIAIAKPFIYVLFMSTKRVLAFICAAWILPFTFSFVPHAFIYNERHVDTMRRYTYFMLIVFEFIPPVSLVLVTAHMLYIARKHARETAAVVEQLRYNQPAASSGNAPQARRPNRARTSVIFITSIVLFFVLCYSVNIALSCCQIFYICDYPFGLETAQRLLLIANSAFNPFAYGFLKQDIKREVKQLLRVGVTETQRSSFQMEQQR